MLELLAHEIAHQWYGNSVTEQNFSHIWLSEGFATYLSAHYIEHVKGTAAFRNILTENRGQVIGFLRRNQLPVVDSTQTNLMSLLNANSYQRGGWVLHMLRQEVGDSLFWEGLRRYYTTYRNQNATTAQLQAIFESLAGRSLDTFFRQWLYNPAIPRIGHRVMGAEGQYSLVLTQKQPTAFTDMPITVAVTDSRGTEHRLTGRFTGASLTLTIPFPEKPASVTLDPDVQLLFMPD
jgi:aminopeptidase N